MTQQIFNATTEMKEVTEYVNVCQCLSGDAKTYKVSY